MICFFCTVGCAMQFVLKQKWGVIKTIPVVDI